MKKIGFTLAEILIVFSVIGIIATIILSSVSGAKLNRKKVLYKKAYYMLETAVNDLLNDTDLYPYKPDHPGFKNADIVTWPGTNDSYGGFFDVNKKNEIKSGTKASAKYKFCALLQKKLEPIQTENTAKNPCKKFMVTGGIQFTVEPNDLTTKTESPPYEHSLNDVISVFIAPQGFKDQCIIKKIGSGYTQCNEVGKSDKDQGIFRVSVHYDGRMRVSDNLSREFLKSHTANN